jgi:hypothetical protein
MNTRLAVFMSRDYESEFPMWTSREFRSYTPRHGESKQSMLGQQIVGWSRKIGGRFFDG